MESEKRNQHSLCMLNTSVNDASQIDNLETANEALSTYKNRYANIIQHYKNHKNNDITNTHPKTNENTSTPTDTNTDDASKDASNNKKHTNTINLNLTASTDETTSSEEIEPPLPEIKFTQTQPQPEPVSYKLSVYNDVVYVEPYHYWLIHSFSRWWSSQSRDNVYKYFDVEFWNVVRFLEKCYMMVTSSPVPQENYEFLSQCTEFLDELIPSILYLRSVYPEFEEFHSLLQDIADVLYVYYETIEEQIRENSVKLIITKKNT